MKEAFYFLATIFLLALWGMHTEEKIKQSETRIIQAIDKNDSINVVKYLNKEK